MEITPNPGYQSEETKTVLRRFAAVALILLGLAVILFGLVSRTVLHGVATLGVVALGVALIVLPVRYLVRAVRIDLALEKKDRALREPGTVELLTMKSWVVHDSDLPDSVGLRSDLRVRLDNGYTISGPYSTRIQDPTIAAQFHVGARLHCLVNPAKPETVWVPVVAPGDALPAPDADLNGRAVFFNSTQPITPGGPARPTDPGGELGHGAPRKLVRAPSPPAGDSSPTAFRARYGRWLR
jgi:hypothetical protein